MKLPVGTRRVRRMIELETELKGMKTAEDAMRILRQLGSRITGATFNGLRRKDGTDMNNAEVASDLVRRKPSWDMFSGGKETKEIMQAYADEAVRRTQVKMAGTGGVGESDATEIEAGAMMAAIRKWAEIVIKRFEEQKNAAGGRPARVNVGYAIARQIVNGVSPEIFGIATGDLLANIASGDESIRLKAK